MKLFSRISCWTVATIILSICAAQFGYGAPTYLKKVSSKQLPQLMPDGSLEDFKTALRRQLEACSAQPLNDVWYFGKRKVSRKKWCIDTGQAFLKLANESYDFQSFYEKAKKKFDWYQSVGRDGLGEVMFTGYNAPHLRGTLKPDEQHRFPIYRKPDDLVRVLVNGKVVWRKQNPDGSFSSYWDRKAIDSDGVLQGKNLEVAYVDDLFSAFILQVEGAGTLQITYPDGSEKQIFVNYEAANGHPFVQIRKILEQQGVPAEYLTIPGQRRYFRENPEKLVPTLIQNPSYVFFRESNEGPYGVDNILLSAGHSVAVDLSVFPVGGITFFKTQRPIVTSSGPIGWEDFSRFAISQDTGGSIKGPGRIDIFWGNDSYAEIASGTMSNLGTLYFALVPRK